MAPAQPSAQDQSVAAAAAQTQVRAQVEAYRKANEPDQGQPGDLADLQA